MLRAKPARGKGRKKPAKGWRSSFSARGAAIFLLVALIGLAGAAGFVASASADRIVPGVLVNSLDVSDKTPEEARQFLEKSVNDFRLVFASEEARLSIPANIPLQDGRRPVAKFDVAAAAAKAFEVGHGQEQLTAAAQRIDAYVFGKEIKMPITLDMVELNQAIMDKFGELAGPAQDAHLSIKPVDGGQPIITVLPEQAGVVIDLDHIAKEAANRLKSFSTAPITIRQKTDRPNLAAADVEPLKTAAAEALSRAPLTLAAKDITWTISASQIADWIDAVPTFKPETKAKLSFDPEKVLKYLGSRAAALTVQPTEAVFEMQDGKVTAFTPSADGEEVDVEATVALLETAVFGPDAATSATIDLPFKKIPPRVDTASSNPYGIREIVGTGESNFKGSPKNRRSNIAVGAKTLNGIIIPADKEFSLLEALGPIDESQGYLKELVIKENKTVPEYGGGLCQIGTTAFRAALGAGLPITERRNHSYRVVYYERDGSGKAMGPGKDATIYNPWPDFKFKNDTGNALLLLTAIDGDRLTFTFWGTKDGRTAEQTDAIVSNIVPPPEKKIIETADLKPGETKCTESPHAGADAVFTYTVTYPNGEVKEKKFYSHYKPWGEVCLVGIDPNAVPAPGAAALPSADVVGASGR